MWPSRAQCQYSLLSIRHGGGVEVAVANAAVLPKSMCCPLATPLPTVVHHALLTHKMTTHSQQAHPYPSLCHC